MNTGVSSFRALFRDDHRIEIPVIQRDYAQGREDEHSLEVRKRFLDSLAETLVERTDTAPLDLDFIYGRWDIARLTLEPIDGQQRLTTLFLLHWYIASHDKVFGDFQSWITLSNDRGSCFTYRTRPAAREFFDALVKNPAPLGTISTEPSALSNWMTNSVWFVKSWRRDPTVRGCLTMLDAIHERFAVSVGVWLRLVSTESPAIIFQLLPLEHFNLSDDLYIKMNARGKALTSFEVLKAQLESFAGATFGEEPSAHEPGTNWREYISRRFDNEWTLFLWKHRGSTSDTNSQFIHLIRALAIVHCVNRDGENLSKQVEDLLATPEPSLPFLREIGCLDRALVELLVNVLDTLARQTEAPNFLGRANYMGEEAVFRQILLARGANEVDGLTLDDWVMFYAWCVFLFRFSMNVACDQVRASFNDWIRVVRNLAANSYIDRNERLVAALRGLGQLSRYCGADFLSRVANGVLDEIGGFNQQQQREEQIKAQLVQRNASWTTLIEHAETHRYFRGSIEFLLRFSGLFNRAAQSQHFDWSDEEDSSLQRLFLVWYDRACAIFPEEAKAWPAQFPGFYLERALLATGDYLLRSGRNSSLLDDKDRDASWKRLLRADMRVADAGARRDVICRVLARIDPRDALWSLQSIVAAGVQGDDSVPVRGFRSRLVAEPRLIEYCKRRMLRLEDDSAFLLAGIRRSGPHVDLYVYDLYLRTRCSKRRTRAVRKPGISRTIPDSTVHNRCGPNS